MKIDDQCNPLRVLVVGTGSIGERHVRCFSKLDRVQVSICETNPVLLEDVGDRYAIEHRYSTFDAALNETIDAAVIAVPADLHIPFASQAVAAGLHILVEKPLSTSLAGIDDLVSLVERQERIGAVGYVYRAHPLLEAMRNAIRSGTFGNPLQVSVVAGQHFPTYRPTYVNSYYVSRARGGGAIQDAMTHLVNAVEWLVGPVDRVIADADHKAIENVEVEDVVTVLSRHGSVIGSYSLNQFQAPNEATITVVCERGTARFEYHKNRWRRMMKPGEAWHSEAVHGLERDSLFVRQAESFLAAIAGRGAPLCTLAEGLQTLRVNLALLASVEQRNWQIIR